MKDDCNRLPNLEPLQVAVDDVRQDPWPLLQLHVRQHVRQVAIVALTAAVDRVTVDPALPGGGERGEIEAAALRAERARVPDHRAAAVAARQHEFACGG